MKKAHKLGESDGDNTAYAAITFPAIIVKDYGSIVATKKTCFSSFVQNQLDGKIYIRKIEAKSFWTFC